MNFVEQAIVSPKEVIIKERVVKVDPRTKVETNMYVEIQLKDVTEENIDNLFFNIYGVTLDEVKSGKVQMPAEIAELFPAEDFNLTASIQKGESGEYVRAQYRRIKGKVTPEVKAKWFAIVRKDKLESISE